MAVEQQLFEPLQQANVLLQGLGVGIWTAGQVLEEVGRLSRPEVGGKTDLLRKLLLPVAEWLSCLVFSEQWRYFRISISCCRKSLLHHRVRG